MTWITDMGMTSKKLKESEEVFRKDFFKEFIFWSMLSKEPILVEVPDISQKFVVWKDRVFTYSMVTTYLYSTLRNPTPSLTAKCEKDWNLAVESGIFGEDFSNACSLKSLDLMSWHHYNRVHAVAGDLEIEKYMTVNFDRHTKNFKDYNFDHE